MNKNGILWITGLVVLILIVFWPADTKVSQDSSTQTPTTQTTQRKAEPETYRKTEVQVSEEWSERFFTLSDENRTVWEIPGLEARTNSKELVLYPPLGDGRLGAHRWVQFRMNGGGRIKTCTHPKGTTADVCK